MSMRLLAGHQPNLLPWIGYFEKINRCDVFVFADDVQFAKQTFTNRVMVSVGGREQFLILPVQGPHTDLIKAKAIVKDPAGISRTIGILSQIANESRYGEDVLEVVDRFGGLLETSSTLGEVNTALIQFLLNRLEISTETVVSSDLKIGEARGTNRIAKRCLACGANCYLAGQGSEYIDSEELADLGVAMRVIDYRLPAKMTASRSHLSIINALGDFGWTELVALFRRNREEGSAT